MPRTDRNYGVIVRMVQEGTMWILIRGYEDGKSYTGRWCYAFRAIDEDGQVIDVYVSPTRDTAAATTFLTQAVESTEVTPSLATTDRAAIYPPALAAVLPEVTHIRGKLVQQRIERE